MTLCYERICVAMQCNIGDIVDYVPDSSSMPKGVEGKDAA